MNNLPTETELYDSFVDFYSFTLELIEKTSKDRKYIKFAAINAQISLELFLKFYFAKSGNISSILKMKRGKTVKIFKDFSEILSYYFSTRKWSNGVKKEFVSLLETRNSIVHKGINNLTNEDIATIVVKTIFFIHATANDEFSEFLLNEHYGREAKIAYNPLWTKGVKSFVGHLQSIWGNDIASTCLRCEEFSVVTGDFFSLEEYQYEKHLVCLNCLTTIDTELQATLIKCYECDKKSYILDHNNEQNHQLFVGKCTECEASTWVRKCHECEIFYHPPVEDEKKENGKYFCSIDCVEIYRESFETAE